MPGGATSCTMRALFPAIETSTKGCYDAGRHTERAQGHSQLGLLSQLHAPAESLIALLPGMY